MTDNQKSNTQQITQVVQNVANSSSPKNDFEFAVLYGPGLLHVFESILEYAVGKNEDPELQLKTVRAIRLVQKFWTNTLANIKRTKHECLYYLKLDHANSIIGAPHVQSQEKLLDQFVKVMETRVEERVPPFHITFQPGFFRAENYDSFASCFKRCGSGLQELTVNLPKDGGSLPGVYSNAYLSALKRMKVCFTSEESPQISANNEANATLFLSSLLTNNKTLKELEFSSNLRISRSLEYLCLPATLSKLSLESSKLYTSLDLLERNQLPLLEHLTIFVAHEDVIDGDKFFNVMCKLKGILKGLLFTREACLRQESTQNRVKFPVFSSLDELGFMPINLELADDHVAPATCFPKLKKLMLFGHSEAMFLKWVSCTEQQFSTVTQFAVELVDKSEEDSMSDFVQQVTDEHMRFVSRSFPNLTRLELSFNASEREVSAITYIFKQMRQLTDLHFIIAGTSDIQDADFFDSVLTGVPEELVCSLKKNEDFWKNLDLKNETPSIRNLTELTTLGLHDEYEEGNTSLISDFSFVFAFLKMPWLTELKFEGKGFLASREMTELWKGMNKKIHQSDRVDEDDQFRICFSSDSSKETSNDGTSSDETSSDETSSDEELMCS